MQQGEWKMQGPSRQLGRAACAVFGAGLALTSVAGEVRAEEGGRSSPWEGGVVATFQHANDGRIRSEAAASADLIGTFPAGPGEISVHFEGNTSPRVDGVSTRLPEVNADIGTALDRYNHGRLQLSELNYAVPSAAGTVTGGLIDATAYLDASEVAGDEGLAFLAKPFKNNPTINFPDYSLGLALSREPAPAGGLGYSLVVASSHGLADNPDRSYEQLVDMGNPGKGLFAAAELAWRRGSTVARVGLWSNTADHDRLDRPSVTTAHNSGVYTSVDGAFGKLRWNVRLGRADSHVSRAAGFGAVALEVPVAGAALGAAYGRILASPDLTNAADERQTEIYVRFAAAEGFYITPSLQWIRNSEFTPAPANQSAAVVVSSLRLTYAF